MFIFTIKQIIDLKQAKHLQSIIDEEKELPCLLYLIQIFSKISGESWIIPPQIFYYIEETGCTHIVNFQHKDDCSDLFYYTNYPSYHLFDLMIALTHYLKKILLGPKNLTIKKTQLTYFHHKRYVRTNTGVSQKILNITVAISEKICWGPFI